MDVFGARGTSGVRVYIKDEKGNGRGESGVGVVGVEIFHFKSRRNRRREK